jgi:predicted nucleotidyltransferase
MINIDAVKPKIKSLAEKYGLSLVLLFGSQATGHTHKNSDIDIGYVCRRYIDYAENYAICLELMRIFKHKDIEFTNIYNVSPAMKKQIADTGISLYGKNAVIFDYFKIHAFREYMDTKPLRIYRDLLVKDFIKTYA